MLRVDVLGWMRKGPVRGRGGGVGYGLGRMMYSMNFDEG